MKTLSDIGEFGFIDKIASKYSQQEINMIGIGDDCSVVPLNDQESRLVTTDLLIENIHFLRDKITAEDLGYKSLAVNLSDIAAMGGIPQEIYISIGLPENIKVGWLDKFYASMHELADKFNARLMGGDTTSSKNNIIINILVIGKIKTKNIKYRSDARESDIICLNGNIGDSPAGLKILLEDKKLDKTTKKLVHAHNHPEPRIEEGKCLAEHSIVHAMMDVSDGIGSDIFHIMERSKLGARINLESLPISKEMLTTAKKYNWDVFDLAINGGEDYCLLFTVAPAGFEELKRIYDNKFKSPIVKIGVIKNPAYGIKYFKDGKQQSIRGKGFDHFKK